MSEQGSYSELLYQYEILRARLEIRDHYLKNAVKEVYDNVGQVLSLIRVQLSLLQLEFESGKVEKIDVSDQLVGKTIRDLRGMCQLFYPEAGIVNFSGFNRAIAHEIKTLFPEAVCRLDEKNAIPGALNNEKGLILFGIVLEIISLIRSKVKGRLISAVLKYKMDQIAITMDYWGKLIRKTDVSGQGVTFDLSIFERTALIGGNLQIKNIEDDLIRIKLVIPTNLTLWKK